MEVHQRRQRQTCEDPSAAEAEALAALLAHEALAAAAT